jgi:hypothetical protein
MKVEDVGFEGLESLFPAVEILRFEFRWGLNKLTKPANSQTVNAGCPERPRGPGRGREGRVAGRRHLQSDCSRIPT